MKPGKLVRLPFYLLAAASLLAAQWVLDLPLQPRFHYAPINDWAAAAISLSLPFLLFVLSRHAFSERSKSVYKAFSILVFVPCLIFSGLAVFLAPSMASSIDESFVPISEGKHAFATFRLYRTNCGLLCPDGLVLRKEYDLPIGVSLVTQIWSAYREDEGEVRINDHDAILHVIGKGSTLAEIKL